MSETRRVAFGKTVLAEAPDLLENLFGELSSDSLRQHPTDEFLLVLFDAALPHLKESGNAAVVNLSSIAGIVGRAGPAALIFNDGYAAANRGVSLLTETWARMGAPEVRVNELMLGIVETRHAEGTRGWGLLDDEQKKAIVDHTLLKRYGGIDDVAKAIVFILRDAPFMTGSVIRLDGGYVLGGEKTGPMPDGIL